MSVTVVSHPLVQHKLTIMRMKETSTASFRRLLKEISLLLCYEVTRDLDLTTTMIETLLTKEIFKTLDYAKNRRCCVLIQGRTGRGKSEAARAWCRKRKEAYYIDCPAEGGRPALGVWSGVGAT